KQDTDTITRTTATPDRGASLMLSRHTIVGVSLLSLALCIAGGAAGYVLSKWEPEVPLDADHCPSTPPATWFGVFDITDIRPRQEQDRITKAVLAIAERMRKYERLVLHVITSRAEDSSAPWPLPNFPDGFRLCKPADPKA